MDLDDVYKFDPVALQWTQIKPEDLLGSIPSARNTLGFASANGNIYAYGGISESGAIEWRCIALATRFLILALV